ncbi:MAG: sensor histidine kinase [Thermoanaerobaculia bacterium]
MTVTQPILRGTDRWARRAFAASVMISLAVLLSWASGSWELWTFGAEYVPMAPSTALAIGAIAAAGWLRQGRGGSVNVNRLVFLVAAGVGLTGAGVLVQQWLGNDVLTLLRTSETVGEVPVGRMSPLTAVAALLASTALALRNSARRELRRVGAAVALALSLLGIIVIVSYAFGTPLLYGRTVIPMAASTALAFGFLGIGLLLASGADTWPLSLFVLGEDATPSAGSLKAGFIALFVVVLSVLGVVTASWIRRERDETRRTATEAISVIADLKSRQIADWHGERLAGAEAISRSPMEDELRRFAFSPDDQARHDLLDWMRALCDAHGYSSAALIESDGTVRLGAFYDVAIADADALEICREALQTNRVISRGFYRATTGNRTYFDIAIPFRGDDLGIVLLLRVDVEQSLLPRIAHWPLLSRTGESLLFTREGDGILFLNPLRQLNGKTPPQHLPISQMQGTPAYRAIEGFEGVVEGPDYRGEPVIGAVRAIPGSPWFLVAKADQREIYARFRHDMRYALFAVVVLLLAVAVGIRALSYRKGLHATERQLEIERRLQEASRNFRALFDQAAVGVAQIEISSGRIVAANRRYCEIVGSSEEGVVSLSSSEVVHPDDRRRISASLQRMIDDDLRELMEECRYIRRDGNVRTVSRTVSPLWNPGEEPLSFVVVVRDVTNEKEMADALVTRDRLLIEVGRIAKVGGWDFEPGTGKGTWTPEVARIHDLDPEDKTSLEIGLSFYEGRYRETIEHAVREATELGKSYDLELQLTSAKGTRKWVHTVGRPTVENGKVTKVRGSIQDITDRKLAEEEVRTLNRELEERVAKRTAELEAARSEQEAFSYSVSHDLRAPLRGIDGWSLALLEDFGERLDEKGREYLGRVRSEAQKMGRLIDDMLKLSRITRQELHLAAVDLSGLAQRIVARLREDEPGRDVETVVEPGVIANCDAGLMEVALTNLLDNAWKFSSRRTAARIEFGCSEDHGAHVYFVRDNGAGFDMQYASRLFAPFQRMHTPSEFPGSGIGLATVERIISRHGGTIRAESAVDRGTTIRFTLGS